jgi:hypothetical protein
MAEDRGQKTEDNSVRRGANQQSRRSTEGRRLDEQFRDWARLLAEVLSSIKPGRAHGLQRYGRRRPAAMRRA